VLRSPTSRWRGPKSALVSLALGLGIPAGLLAGAFPASTSPIFSLSHLVPAAGAHQNIAAVSTSSTTEEVFYVPQDGSVQEKYFYQGIGWNSIQVAPPGSASPYADIAAVARDRNTVADKIDVFWVGPNGSVEHAYYQDGLPWLRYPQVAPSGSASTIGSLAAVSRESNTWEIFWLSPNADVEDAYYYDGGPSGRFVLAPHSSSTPNLLRGHISVVSRASNTMEVFWIGSDGSIQDRYYYDGFGWNGFTLAAPGSALALGSPAER
jgi:hypothetical protein